MSQATTPAKAVVQACSHCYERKIKCILTKHGGCQACEKNNLRCRLRPPKKLGRPRGASHHSFSIYTGTASRNRQASKQKSQEPSDSGSSSTRSSTSPSTEELYIDSSTRASPPKNRNSVPKQTVTRFPQTSGSSYLELSETALPGENPTLSEQGISPPLFPTLTMDFMNLFPDTSHVNDTFSTEEDWTSTFYSLFNLYLEAQKILTEVRSGVREVPVTDLKDGHGMMRTIININELGSAIIETNHSQPSPCLMFAFIAVLKGCELAEQISITVLPTARTPAFPVVASEAPLASDYIWTTCPSASQSQPKPELSVEHITALVRLDVHLQHFNTFLSNFIHLTQEQGQTQGQGQSQGLSPNALDSLAVQCQKRLLHLHTRIKSVVNFMISAWD